MERSSSAQPPHGREQPAQDRSTGELVTMMAEQVSMLIRDELELARLEMTSKGRQAAATVGVAAAGSLVAGSVMVWRWRKA